MNKYETWYTDIAARGQLRSVDSYTEKHHIVPRSLGGTDDVNNLTHLTAREHFIAHWLLVKMNTGEARVKMVYALRMMKAETPKQQRYKTKITSRVYASLKEEYSKIASAKFTGKNNPMYGKPVSDEIRKGRSDRAKGDNNPARRPGVGDLISAAKTGKKRAPFSKEWLEKLAESNRGENNGMFGRTHSAETKAKQSAKAIGRKQSAETISKKAEAIRGSKREKKLCPHCNQEIAVNTYARWHGDNCKLKQQ